MPNNATYDLGIHQGYPLPTGHKKTLGIWVKKSGPDVKLWSERLYDLQTNSDDALYYSMAQCFTQPTHDACHASSIGQTRLFLSLPFTRNVT